jgi:hypothetical protein
MAIYTPKYEMIYGNISGDNFRLELSVIGSYDGDLIPMVGYCNLTKKAVDDFFVPIRGGSLNIFFDASIEQPFEEFNVIQEFQLLAKFYRNGLEIFRGWINPDGVFQDYVNDKWSLNLTALDGLGFIKNYEFDNNDVLAQEANYLRLILNRLNLGLNFALFDDINSNYNVGNGIPNFNEFINQTKRIVNPEVFRNKNGRFLSCEVVLKDILQKYNFFLSQENINGELVWLIARTPFLAIATNQKGIVLSYDTQWTIESYFGVDRNFVCDDINSSFTPHDAIHCNKNQQISYNPALQNFRFTQNWLGALDKGFGKPTDVNYDLLSNSEFVSNGLRLFPTETLLVLGATQDTPYIINRDNPVSVNFVIEYEIKDSNYPSVVSLIQVIIKATDPITSTDLYLKNTESGTQWVDTASIFSFNTIPANEFANTPLIIKTQIETPTINNVEITIDFFRPFTPDLSPLPNVFFRLTYTNVSIFLRDPLLGNGEFHDCTRTNFASSFLKDPVVVINSNENNNLFTNNLYQIVGGIRFPQNSWFKGNSSPTYADLLELTSRERIDMLQRPQMRFKGDVYGYVNYWNVLNYDKIDGSFFITEYSYKTKDNIISLECQQYFVGDVAKEYKKSYIFENETNVLIR